MIAFISFGTSVFADDGALLKELNSSDRAIRKNAVKQLEAFSREDLVALAKSAVQVDVRRSSDTLNKMDAIYTFHRIMAIAQKKGFGLDDALALLKKTEPIKVRCAFMDWIKEVGVDKISPERTEKLLSELSGYFTSKSEPMELRDIAHKVCRALVSKMNVGLRNDKNMGKAQQEKIARVIQGHINGVCRIVTDESEAEETVETFAGYIPYYRMYTRDGIYSDEDLKAALDQASKQSKRSEKTRKYLLATISRGWKSAR